MGALISWTLVLVMISVATIGMYASQALNMGVMPNREVSRIASICGLIHGVLPVTVDLAFAADETLPNIFAFTHYEFIGDPANPEGVRYLSTGQPSAQAPDGSTVILTGHGGWDSVNNMADGGGQYTIKDAAGTTTAQGSWHVTGFVSFDQLPLDDWWGIPGFIEEGWEGGPNAVSFSGFLTLNVTLDNLGDAVLRTWCLMPTAAQTQSHVGDGISLIGDNVSFGAQQAEQTMFDNLEGVMFYSTDPNATGWVLNPAGIAVAKDEGLKGFEAPSSPDGGGYSPK